jgi:hypothetical protein
MTSYTKREARDAVLELIYNGIKADAYTGDLKIIFDDDDNDDSTGTNLPKSDESWLEIYMRHNAGGQSTLQGASGSRRFQRDGVIAINVYTPRGNNLKASDDISEIICSILENSNIPIWFRNTISSEIGNFRSWYLTSITSEFTYDQIR